MATQIGRNSAFRNAVIVSAKRNEHNTQGQRGWASMPRVETIQGLQRGLRVLKFLQSQPIASLHEIFIATRISKPSLMRVLNTLEGERLVSRRLADGRYRLNASGGVARKRDRYDRVAEAAAPVLFRLCEKVKWPSDLCV